MPSKTIFKVKLILESYQQISPGFILGDQQPSVESSQGVYSLKILDFRYLLLLIPTGLLIHHRLWHTYKDVFIGFSVTEQFQLLCHILKVLGLNSTAVQYLTQQFFNPIFANSEHKMQVRNRKNECYGGTECEKLQDYLGKCQILKRDCTPCSYLGQEDLMTRNVANFFFLTHGSVHHDSMLIKRSNLMQRYADIYLLHSHSTCFGHHSTHHQEYQKLYLLPLVQVMILVQLLPSNVA